MNAVVHQRLFLLLSLFFLSTGQALVAGEISLSGKYLGRNVFIRNPFLTETGAFCITEVYLNGNRLPDLPRTTAIQIDLSSLKLYEEVKIKVMHHEGCIPEFINPEVVQQDSDFQFLYVQIDDNSINWITTGEVPGGKFYIEKYKYKGWEKTDSVEAKGKIDNNQYSVTAHHYAGSNDYRLIYQAVDGAEVQGEDLNFYSSQSEVSISPPFEVIDWIELSRKTDYEVYDEQDRLLLKGFGDFLSVEHLDYGNYFIVIENEPIRIYKPEPEIIPRPRKKRKRNNKN